MTTILQTKGLTKRFGGLAALSNIDFDLESGMIAGLIGPNGAGKTTFFNCITGIYSAERGSVLFLNRNIRDLKRHMITRRGISRTFQNIRLFNHMTALENILVGRHCRMRAGIWGAITSNSATAREEREAIKRAQGLLEFMGLLGKEDVLAKGLPYGDQRRLEIARALATEPKALLLDEPTAGMNPQETGEMNHLIQRIQAELGVTVLLIEHDMRVVMNICDRVTVFDYGVKICEGSPEKVQKDPKVIEAYLGRGGTVLGKRSTTNFGGQH